MIIIELLQPIAQGVAPAPQHHISPIIVETAQLVANAAILATAIFVWRQVKVAIKHLTAITNEQTRGRALDFIRRYNESHGRPMVAYRACGDQSKSTTEKVKMLEGDDDMKATVKTECNFFEELGIAHFNGLVDKEVAFSFFGVIVPTTYETYRFWVEHRQTSKGKSAEKIYENFSALEEEYKRRLKKD